MEDEINLQPLIKLCSEEIHVWEICLEASGSMHEFEAFLAPNELDRARRHKADYSRMEFVKIRGMLRILLSSYLAMDPKDVLISYGRWGKPEIRGLSGICFNVSHSWGKALIAISNIRRIGVDVERVRSISEIEKIAEMYFSIEEVCELLSLPQEERQDAFYRCWTRKEAFTKCIGMGLSFPLSTFQVTLRGG